MIDVYPSPPFQPHLFPLFALVSLSAPCQRQYQLASTPTNQLTCTYHEPHYKKKAQTAGGMKCFKIGPKNKNKIKGPRKMSALPATLAATSPL